LRASPIFRFVVFCHRWLGLALCLLFAMWFASGFVMMYWSFPEISAEERMERAEPLNAATVRVLPQSAWSQAQSPDEARLTMIDHRPVYRFRLGRSETLVYADTGGAIRSISPDMALRVAARWMRRPAAEAKFEGTLRDADQWTVSGEYGALRPLLKYSWPDGDQVYVSTVTGEVVQHTTRATRLAAYFGAIPHWLYWTPLRKNGPAWNKVVEWSSGIATLVGILGLTAGVWIYSPRRRIPYQGQKRWHMLCGLAFGTLSCTWAFSGLLSMEPFEWLLGDNQAAFDIQTALRGGPLDLNAFSAKPPSDALAQAGPGTKELDLALFGGAPLYLADSRMIPLRGDSSAQFDPARILNLVAEASRPATIAEWRVLTRYDAYYLDRHRRHPLPALFVRLNDAQATTLYIDLKTAQIAEAYNQRSRWNRWLYHGLHSWNLPWLYRHRPAWDIMVMAFLVGGTSLSVTAVILGFQLVRRKAHATRVPIS
jgi:hypothetical protein